MAEMKSFESHTKHRTIGVAVYWLGWAHDVIPLGFLLYCIYLCTLLAHRYWIKVIGAGSLACTIIVIIFCILSILGHILYQFSLIKVNPSVRKYIFMGITIVTLIMHAVLLSFFTPSTMIRYGTDITEFSKKNNATDSDAKYYTDKLSTLEGSYEVFKLVNDRTVTPKAPVVSFFIVWITIFVLYVIGLNIVEKDLHEFIAPELPMPRNSNIEHPLDENHTEPNDNDTLAFIDTQEKSHVDDSTVLEEEEYEEEEEEEEEN